MAEIRVGDKVAWKPKYQSKKIPALLTGTVRKLHGGRKPWAAVWVDMVDKPGFWCVDLDRLTVIATDATPAPLPATGAEPLAALCEDYEEMLRWSGSLD